MLAACVGFGSERRLSVEARDEGVGADMAVEVVGRYGWRKATAAAISVGESSVHFSAGCRSLN